MYVNIGVADLNKYKDHQYRYQEILKRFLDLVNTLRCKSIDVYKSTGLVARIYIYPDSSNPDSIDGVEIQRMTGELSRIRIKRDTGWKPKFFGMSEVPYEEINRIFKHCLIQDVVWEPYGKPNADYSVPITPLSKEDLSTNWL